MEPTARMNDTATVPASGIDAEAFAFVSELADDLSRGRIELPSFPDIAMRVRQALANEDVSTPDVVRIVGSEPALAGRILAMANSAALGRTDRQITELRSAVTRIGFNLVRSAAIAFAMMQLRKVEAMKDYREPLEANWKRSALVASFSFVVAKRHTGVNADTALLTGRCCTALENYTSWRAARNTRNYLRTRRPITRSNAIGTAASRGSAARELGHLGRQSVNAVSDYEDLAREHDGVPDLTDVLTCRDIAGDLPRLARYPRTEPAGRQGRRTHCA